MADERRYQPEEIEAIFENAAAPERSRGRALSPSDGLTLPELQAIGREVGIEPADIARAAAALDRRGASIARRTSLGLPISTGRVLELPRAPTDREWATLLGELRQTFGAQGKDVSRGEARGWINGNLHAHIEPTDTGWRLRMGTLKGDAAAIHALGFGGLFTALVLVAVLAVTGELADKLLGPLIIALGGLAALGRNVLLLPRWADERERQMEHIAERARGLLGAGTPEPTA